MGTLFLVLCWNTLLVIFLLLFMPFRGSFYAARIYVAKIKRQLFWNNSILFLQEAYIDLLFACVIQIMNFKEIDLTKTISISELITNLFAIILLFQITLLPLILVCHVWPNYAKLRSGKW